MAPVTCAPLTARRAQALVAAEATIRDDDYATRDRVRAAPLVYLCDLSLGRAHIDLRASR